MKALMTVIGVLIGAVVLTAVIVGGNMGPGPKIDPRLESVVNEWRRDLDRAGIDYSRPWSRLESIEVQSRSESTAGHAVGHRLVTIDPRVFELGSESLRGAVYHELGHAVFRLSHGTGIMDPVIHSEAEYAYHWDSWRGEYLDLCRENLYQTY